MMTDDSPSWPWPPMQQVQETSEQMAQSQQELWQQFVQASAGGSETMSDLTMLSRGTAMFKTRVQSSGRISIPDAEREALDIDEGDIVQTIVIPIKQSDTNE